MYAHAPGFDNPQFVAERLCAQRANQVACTRQNRVGLCSRRGLKNDDTCRVLGRETQHVAEIMVQRYQRTPFARANSK
jgi:hypothetical protein